MDYKMSEVNTNRTVAIVFNKDSEKFQISKENDEYVGVISGDEYNYKDMVNEFNPTEVDIFADIDFDNCKNSDANTYMNICDNCYDNAIMFNVYDIYDEFVDMGYPVMGLGY